MNEKRKGIWIAVELMSDKKLDWMNKVLLSEILSLHELSNGCIASNEHFGELLGIDRSAASKRISKLKKLGYIQTKDVYDRKSCIGRIIIPTIKVPTKTISEQKDKKQNDSPSQQEDNGNNAHGQGSVENPKHLADYLEGSSDKNHTLLTEDHGGSSPTIKGVVPEQPKGSSGGNTISTSICSDLKEPLLFQNTGEIELEPSNDSCITTEISSISNAEGKIEETPVENSSSTFCSAQSTQCSISITVLRDIMNDFFYGYPTWEPDLMRLGLDEFLRRTPHYHMNKEHYIDLIREFFEL